MFTRFYNSAGNFMAQDEGQGMARGNVIEREPGICVTHTATRDLNHNFISSRFKARKVAALQGSLASYKLESVGTGNGDQRRLLDGIWHRTAPSLSMWPTRTNGSDAGHKGM